MLLSAWQGAPIITWGFVWHLIGLQLVLLWPKIVPIDWAVRGVCSDQKLKTNKMSTYFDLDRRGSCVSTRNWGSKIRANHVSFSKLRRHHSIKNRTYILHVIHFSSNILRSGGTDKNIRPFVLIVIARGGCVTIIVVSSGENSTEDFVFHSNIIKFGVVKHTPSFPILVANSTHSHKLVCIVHRRDPSTAPVLSRSWVRRREYEGDVDLNKDQSRKILK